MAGSQTEAAYLRHPKGRGHHHDHPHDHFLGPVGGTSFTAGCCALWTVALVGLGLAIASFVWLAVTTHRVGKVESCCDAATESQSLGDGETFAVCHTGSGTVGVTNITGDYTEDECDGSFVIMARFVTPNNLTTATTLEVCGKVGDIDDPAPGFSVAIYADDGFGVPTIVLGNSSTAPLTANDWNCQDVAVTIGESQYIWLAFMTEGATCDITNNLYFRTHPFLRSVQRDDFTFPVWTDVDSSSSVNYVSYVYGMYVSYNSSCIGPV